MIKDGHGDMIQLGGRFTALMGGYGSGKTELAIAIALHMRGLKPGRVALVDMDIVNPYFRSAEQKARLNAAGVEVLMPAFAMTSVDIPVLPAEFASVFQGDYAHVVIDVGGDDTGATALGVYTPYIAAVRDEMTALYVINSFRPMCGDAREIAELYRLIAQKARLTPDYLVNNGNLQEQTTAEDIIASQRVVEDAARELNVPVGMVVGMARLKDELPEAMRDMYFALEPVMKPDWLVDG